MSLVYTPVLLHRGLLLSLEFFLFPEVGNFRIIRVGINKDVTFVQDHVMDPFFSYVM